MTALLGRGAADPDPLGALTAARRRRRLSGADWFDTLYNVYLTAIGVAVGTAVVASFLPEAHVSSAVARQVVDEGPALAGLAVAIAVAIGLRSGGRGGPLALELPFVHTVLLSPVERKVALRGPALGTLRFGVFAGGIGGAAAGLVASGRLDGGGPSWVASGAATGALTAVLALGGGLVVSGRRLRMWMADLLALVVIGLSALDVSQGTRLAPGTWLGALALAPLRADPTAVAGVLLPPIVATAGVAMVGGTSLEAALRRGGLVSQLRFAVTMQDLRTVVLLRRQLAQERPRSRPWVRLSLQGTGPLPVARRDLRSLLRFPAVRVTRMVALGAGAGLALRGAWSGTTPLLLVAALALFVAALDAIEPLSQEADRPGRWASFPVPDGRLLLQHLLVPALAMVLVGGAAVAAAEVAGPNALVLELGATLVPVVAAAAVVGAAGSVAMGSPNSSSALGMPEAAGSGLLLRLAWPPGLVAVSLAPLLVARSATERASDPLRATTGVLLPVVLVVAVAAVWLSTRKAPRS